jgi:hypothetical protein
MLTDLLGVIVICMVLPTVLWYFFMYIFRKKNVVVAIFASLSLVIGLMIGLSVFFYVAQRTLVLLGQ